MPSQICGVHGICYLMLCVSCAASAGATGVPVQQLSAVVGMPPVQGIISAEILGLYQIVLSSSS